MKTEIGEYVVGAYLSQRLKCDFVGFNVRPPDKGLAGLGELDVVGLQFSAGKAYLCEVTTHLDGVLYGTYDKTISKIRAKHKRQLSYAKKYLGHFKEVQCMFWAPRVPEGPLTKKLGRIRTLKLVVNEDYTRCVRELQEDARKTTKDMGNPFFRTLQILTHLRGAT